MNNTSYTASVVTCQQLRLVSDDGMLFAMIGGADGHSYFQMYDRDGRVRVQVQLSGSGFPSIVLWDVDSSPAISMGVGQTGENTRGITIHGRQGVPLLSLTVTGEDHIVVAGIPR